jgi:hypothetical protein
MESATELTQISNDTNPIDTLPSYLRLILILFSQQNLVFETVYLRQVSCFPRMPHAPPTSSCFLWSFQ